MDVKAAQRALYEAGDCYALSKTLEPVARELVDAAGVDAAGRVLDVGAGDGNVAIASARRGARVVAVDLTPVQVDRGRERCAREGVDVEWQVGDAEQLQFRDAAFTHVLSAFGAVFAPDPDRVTAELVRVCASGGVVALTAWPPDSFIGESTRRIRDLSPPGRSFPDVENGWGVAETAAARLAPHAAHVRVERRTLMLDPAVRGAAGAADCAASFVRALLAPEAVEAAAATREALGRKYARDGLIAADYVLIVARGSSLGVE